MPKRAKDLTALEVQRLAKSRKEGMHAVGGVVGLYLNIAGDNAASWIFRTKVGELRRSIGLGSYPEISLAMAHDAARAAKANVKAGIDPVEQRREAKSLLMAEQNKAITFEQAANQYLEKFIEGDSGVKQVANKKHISQWRATLTTYAFPFIGQMQVRHIETAHVLKVLSPIWQEKTETASRLRGRIEKILDWCKAAKLRTGDNPATCGRESASTAWHLLCSEKKSTRRQGRKHSLRSTAT